jgi:hypothetical protein
VGGREYGLAGLGFLGLGANAAAEVLRSGKTTTSLLRLQPFNASASASARSPPLRLVLRRHHAAPPIIWLGPIVSLVRTKPAPLNIHWWMSVQGRCSLPEALGGASRRPPGLFPCFEPVSLFWARGLPGVSRNRSVPDQTRTWWCLLRLPLRR